MSKCKMCQVKIIDDSQICPLCQSVLEQTGQGEQRYPDVRVYLKKLCLVSNIVLFLMIVSGAVATYLNYVYIKGIWWSFIVDATMIYVYVFFRFALVGSSSYRWKMVCMTFLAVLLLLLIDWVTGYRGWALSYVLPGGILALDAGILVLMLVNFRNWQSYLTLQIWVLLCSLLPVLFGFLHWVNDSLVGLIAFAVSLFLFLGTLIIGDRRARTELKRRFHIQ